MWDESSVLATTIIVWRLPAPNTLYHPTDLTSTSLDHQLLRICTLHPTDLEPTTTWGRAIREWEEERGASAWRGLAWPGLAQLHCSASAVLSSWFALFVLLCCAIHLRLFHRACSDQWSLQVGNISAGNKCWHDI